MSMFGIYVHWPYCARKCPYCDFNSHVRTSIDESAWTDSILAELEWTRRFQGADAPPVSTIFFGGGTPSLMSGAAAGKIIDRIAKLWPMANDVEITLEANPASAEAARFRDYRAGGVNRLSLGMQALNDDDLKFLGRLHSVAEAKTALAAAMNTFDRVSLDLIYARPDQTVAAWRKELAEALSFGVRHLSLYQLTIEPETPFAVLHRSGALKTPDEDAAATLYEITQELTAAAGVPAYEVSNHAAPGEEARHNLLYWRYGSYAGVGPGAHGRLSSGGDVIATFNEKLPERWRQRVTEDGVGLAEKSVLSRQDSAREHLLMNLRLVEGVDVEGYEKRWGTSLEGKRIAGLEEEGLVDLTQGRLAATARGRLVLNAIIASLAD
jgi:putative oxygen-independent coproporphyrinogen III oxidase